MKKITFTFLLGFTLIAADTLSQKGPARYFGDPIWTDSLSTLFIPTRYNEEFLSSNKIALWGDYYANIIAYNFTTDTYKKVFEKDTFIQSMKAPGSAYIGRLPAKADNITAKWVFLLVKIKDTNISGRIDERDPSVLFAVSIDGQLLKQLTDEKENVVSFDTYEKQGFMLIKIQKDSDNDKSFKAEDKEFYFRKVTLSDLTLGKGIEVN
jgi:hypothetical protein